MFEFRVPYSQWYLVLRLVGLVELVVLGVPSASVSFQHLCIFGLYGTIQMLLLLLLLERIRGFAFMRYINPRLIDWLIDWLPLLLRLGLVGLALRLVSEIALNKYRCEYGT